MLPNAMSKLTCFSYIEVIGSLAFNHINAIHDTNFYTITTKKFMKHESLS
jgi:hypothetical protein